MPGHPHSSTSPGLATVITPCTSGVSRLRMASLWRRFPTRAGRFQSCTFGDSAPLRSLAIVLAVGSRRYRMANRLRLVRSIAPARRSCLVQSKGQPSATMVGIDGILGSLLLSRCIEASRCSFRDLSATGRQRFAVFGGRYDLVRVDDAVGERWRSRWKTFRALQVRRENSSSVTDPVPPDLSLGSTID
jgi:hypothetical protein